MASGRRVRKRTDWNSPFCSIPFWGFHETFGNSNPRKLCALKIWRYMVIFLSVACPRKLVPNENFCVHGKSCYEPNVSRVKKSNFNHLAYGSSELAEDHCQIGMAKGFTANFI